MKNSTIVKLLCTLCVTCFLVIPAGAYQAPTRNHSTTGLANTDFDPLVDIVVNVELRAIRAFDKLDIQEFSQKKIDLWSDPDFYVKVFINDVEFRSDIWRNTKYLYNIQWSATLNVPDDQEFVTVKIQLWDWNFGRDRICDISRDTGQGYVDSCDAEMIYSIKTGTWWGDDYTDNDPLSADPSGYGRLNGCDDGSIYSFERDCELWFNICQNDFDHDTLPYWAEAYMYGTDPMIDNRGDDSDHDGCPIEWEHRFGHYFSLWSEQHFWFYNATIWDDHMTLDPDSDGVSNYEEYLTSQWGSDPFRKDLFVELDLMEPNPDGEWSTFPANAKELLRTAYDRRNIVFYLDDDGFYGGGGELFPFKTQTTYEELQAMYMEYFLHGDVNNWRRGVFHYCLLVYYSPPGGFVFWGGVGPYLDAFSLSTHLFESDKVKPKTQHRRDIVYASALMHECGHTLGIFNGNTPGCDDQNGKYPWQKNFWIWRPYKSVMNYGYMYKIVDYSDGSRGRNDFNDWARIDLTLFQRPMW
ncbi:MAG: hypothetical protein QXX20_01760 [Candidatus Thermoplasmatota archaeon]